MIGEEKNLKDSVEKPLASYRAGTQDMSVALSYTKTNKLIMALYMVTDIIDKDEPLRNKLRTLGIEIISDINSMPPNVCGKISDIMSFLEIASAINLISEMNLSILRKEFLELNQSVLSIQGEKEYIDNFKTINKQINLSGFFKSSIPNEEGIRSGNSFITTPPFEHFSTTKRKEISKGHSSIGVQKGSTLMKALSDKTLVRSLGGDNFMSNKNSLDKKSNTLGIISHAQNFDILKKQRRDSIINIIKNSGESSTIKDIKIKIDTERIGMSICSEKTLQRELVSMIKDGVLKKTGEKRWSRYFIK